MSLYLTPRQVAERWGCSASHVRRLCASGELPAMRLGTDWRTAVAAVEAYEQRRTTRPSRSDAAPKPEAPKEVRAPVTIDGFTLPADYSPVFPDLWPLHETKKGALSSH